MVRDFKRKGLSAEDAIDKATDQCINDGILEQILRNNRAEVRSMLLTEYNEQAHIEYEKEISYEDGRNEGRIEGAIQVYQELGLAKTEIIAKLMKVFVLSEADAQKYVEQYQV